MSEDRLLTIEDLCSFLRVSKPYIYWLTHRKCIPFIKMQGHLRFRLSEVEEWLKKQEFSSDQIPRELPE